MTPIERISARSKALALLGMTGSPTKSDIRKTFRLLAFEKHPDHGKATPEEFARISDAYHLLYETAPDAQAVEAPAGGLRVTRPSLQPTETEFTEETLDACEALLVDASTAGIDHLATRLFRKGRTLTYFVPSAPGKGLNRVALPTGDLVDHRSIQPKVIDVWSGDISAGVFDVPAPKCAKVFPGARSVQIRFGTLARH